MYSVSWSRLRYPSSTQPAPRVEVALVPGCFGGLGELPVVEERADAGTHESPLDLISVTHVFRPVTVSGRDGDDTQGWMIFDLETMVRVFAPRVSAT